MGLDMYLFKKSYIISGEWIKENHRESVTVTKGGKPHKFIKDDRIRYVIEEVGYWRKANQIHNWFVQNVQGGNDDCRNYRVSREKLQELLDLCRIVSSGNNEESAKLLPTASGFFFGGTDYDEWYYQDIKNTIKILEEVLSDVEADDFEYTSSW